MGELLLGACNQGGAEVGGKVVCAGTRALQLTGLGLLWGLVDSFPRGCFRGACARVGQGKAWAEGWCQVVYCCS